MNISVPVTDYIPASVLTTLNDIVVRGASIPARQPGLLRAIGTHIAYFTHNAGGVQAYTGCGFSPSLVIFLAADDASAQQNWSVGVDDGTLHACLNLNTDGSVSLTQNENSIYIKKDGSNILAGVITSLDADGFTYTYSLLGTCGLVGVYLALP